MVINCYLLYYIVFMCITSIFFSSRVSLDQDGVCSPVEVVDQFALGEASSRHIRHRG